MSIFISHSRRDEELTSLVSQALNLLGRPYQAIVYEDLPEAVRQGPDWLNITNLIQNCEIVFLFLTHNVEDSAHTRAWVEHEVATAAAFRRPLVVFQLAGSPSTLPITYWTDLVLLDLQNAAAILQIQAVARAHGPVDLVDNPLARAAAGAAVGSIAGPIGFLIGGIVAALSAPRHPLQQVPQQACQRCGNTFRYWVAPGDVFYCPHCLIPFQAGGT